MPALRPKTPLRSAPTVYREERFRTPLPAEQALGLWVDRIGMAVSSGPELPQPGFRRLGQYAAVAILEGEGFFETERDAAWPVGAGDVLMLFPEVGARYYPSHWWKSCWVVWNGPEARALETLGFPRRAEPMVHAASDLVLGVWTELKPLLAGEEIRSILHRKTLLLNLLLRLEAAAMRGRPGAGVGGTAVGPVESAMDYLTRHPEAEVRSVTELARRCHLSPTHFRRLFKLRTGASPKTWMAALRMTRAKELLAGGGSIKDTAARLGFRDVFHFMRCFRRVTGMTVGAFRG